MFDPITPVRKGGKTYTDTPVELDADTGAELVALLAVTSSLKTPAAVAVAPPAPPGPPPVKPLAKLSKAELLAIVEAEGVEIAADASNKAIVAAIEAKRSASA